MANEKADATGKWIGGWYNNPDAGGANQRYWGNGVWTSGEDPSATPPTFGSANDAQSYVNNYQNSAFNNASSTPKVQSLQDIATDVKGIIDMPEAPKLPSLVDTYTGLKTSSGVADLEKKMQDLTSLENDMVAENRINKNSIMGTPEALGVIGGRVGEAERAAAERMDVVTRQKTQIGQQIQTAYANIQTIMTLTQQDYTNAKQAYDTQFDQAISMLTQVRGIQQDQRDEVQRAQDNARANLQIFINTITKGNLQYNSLGADQKAMVASLEVQAGLPVGFTSSLKMDPGADVMFSNTNNGVTQVGFRNPDGTVSVKSYGTATPTKATDSEKSAKLISTATQLLDMDANTYGHVDKQSWNEARSAWLQSGGTTADFNNNFEQYTDPNRGDFVEYYGFDRKGRTQYDSSGQRIYPAQTGGL